jgi:DNA polymerase III epsilon subunit-like protein
LSNNNAVPEDPITRNPQIELRFQPREPNNTVFFLDCETTGRNPSEHRIISLGLIKVKGNEELDSWEWKFPAKVDDFQPTALEITGWPDEWHEPLDERASAFEELNQVIADRPIGGHNLMFDTSFLRREFKRVDLDAFRLRKYCIDTAVIGSTLVQLGLVESPSLSHLCDYFGVADGKAHRALNDARRSWHVYQKSLEAITLSDKTN